MMRLFGKDVPGSGTPLAENSKIISTDQAWEMMADAVKVEVYPNPVKENLSINIFVDQKFCTNYANRTKWNPRKNAGRRYNGTR